MGDEQLPGSRSSATDAQEHAVQRAPRTDSPLTAAQRTVEITNVGRSVQPRRTAIWLYRLEGIVYLSGLPGRRDWLVNLQRELESIFPLKHGITADLSAMARPVTDQTERRGILGSFVDDVNQPHNLARTSQPTRREEWLAEGPHFAVHPLDFST